MFKVLVLGLLVVSQSALAGFRCSNGYDKKLDLDNVAGGSVLVKRTVDTLVKEFDGKLNLENSQLEGLYKTYDYDLMDSHQVPAHLIVSVTPSFGRGCGRACNKAMPATISAKLSYANVDTIYGCIQTLE